MKSWLLLIYKVSPEPTSRRVFVWRKLKRLGAILLHDSVWVLPPTPHTREQLQWLAAEIVEMSGEALLWEAQAASSEQDETLERQFIVQSEIAYHEILTALSKPDADLAALSRQYQQIKASDYFNTSLGQQVREALMTAKGGTES
jgi:DNA-binding transcriptional regulator PaaX